MSESRENVPGRQARGGGGRMKTVSGRSRMNQSKRTRLRWLPRHELEHAWDQEHAVAGPVPPHTARQPAANVRPLPNSSRRCSRRGRRNRRSRRIGERATCQAVTLR